MKRSNRRALKSTIVVTIISLWIGYKTATSWRPDDPSGAVPSAILMWVALEANVLNYIYGDPLRKYSDQDEKKREPFKIRLARYIIRKWG